MYRWRTTRPIGRWLSSALPVILLALLSRQGMADESVFDAAPDDALLGKIDAMPSNTWLKLPPFKVIGELDWLSPRADERTRGPFGRSYCNHAYWAPERKRALFCGGGHNVRPINDVWEYDLAANTWICLRGADRPFALSEKWFRENAKLQYGIVTTKTGAPVRMHHQWDQVAYDPSRKLLLYVDSMPRSLTYDVKLDEEGNALEKGLGITHQQLLSKLGPDGIYIWEFDASRRLWTNAEFVVNWKGPGNTIGGRQESGILEFLPDKQTVWFSGWGGALVRDASSKTWTRLLPKMRTYGAVGVYDPKSETVVTLRNGNTRGYKLGESKWQSPAENGPQGNDGNCSLHYDPRGENIVLVSAAANPILWLYDAKNKRWIDPKPRGDIPSAASAERMIVYFDAARNVLVYYDSLSTWVYRCPN